MLSFSSQVRIFLARDPVDMRKSFHGLIGLTESVLQEDPLSGHLFVFINRRRDRIKLLYWGGTGFCIWYQQLEKGSYQLPDAATADELMAKIEGRPDVWLWVFPVPDADEPEGFAARLDTHVRRLTEAGKLGVEYTGEEYRFLLVDTEP